MRKNPKFKKIRNWLFYISIKALVKFLRALDRMTAISLMRGLGSIIFLTARNERRKTILHLTLAFGREKSTREIKIIAKNVFKNFATAATDVMRMPILIKKGLNSLVTYEEGVHDVIQALANGKGIILLTGHFGNWELMGAWAAQIGIPLKVVGRSAFDPRIDKMIVEIRNNAGYQSLARGKDTRDIIRTLKQGYPLGLLIDQDTKVEGVFVNFFNRPAHTATGPVILSRKYNVPIFPAFIRLKKDFSYHIYCSEPVKLVDTGDFKKDLITNTQILSDIYEDMIRRFPDQWVWMHRRWKKQPIDISS